MAHICVANNYLKIILLTLQNFSFMLKSTGDKFSIMKVFLQMSERLYTRTFYDIDLLHNILVLI